jgi:hypothetical protein
MLNDNGQALMFDFFGLGQHGVGPQLEQHGDDQLVNEGQAQNLGNDHQMADFDLNDQVDEDVGEWDAWAQVPNLAPNQLNFNAAQAIPDVEHAEIIDLNALASMEVEVSTEQSFSHVVDEVDNQEVEAEYIPQIVLALLVVADESINLCIW